MRMNCRTGAVVLAGFLGIFSGVSRADGPVQLALWPPVQIVPETESVGLLRLSIYSRNQNVSGLDFGFVNEAKGDFGGVAFGLGHLAGQDAYGVQWAFFLNKVGRDLYGWQCGMLNWVVGDAFGLHTGLGNLTDHDMGGLQLGLFNQTRGYMSGLQLGVLNRGGFAEGLQIGLVNIADDLYGLQIGLWNQVNRKETLKILSLVNWKF